MSPIRRDRNRPLTPHEGACLLSAWHQRGDVRQLVFCQQHGVSVPTLNRWLRKAAAPSQPASPAFTEIPSPTWRVGCIQVRIGVSEVSIPMALEVSNLQTVFSALIRAQSQVTSC